MSDSERVWKTIYERGASIVCPFCANEEWMPFGDLGNLRVLLPAATTAGEIVKLPGETGGLSAFAFGCSRCGFIRLHAGHVLAKEQPEGSS